MNLGGGKAYNFRLLSLSTLVLNSRDWQGIIWLPEKMRLWITNIIKIRTQKTYHNASNATKNAVSLFKQT